MIDNILSNNKIKKILKSDDIRKQMKASIAPNLFSGEFSIIIDTTKNGSANDTFILPTDGASVYDYYVDWGDNQTDHVVVNTSQTHVYTIAGVYRIKISGTFPHIYFNNTGDKLKLISIDNWGKVAWNSFEGAFYGCGNLTSVDLTNLDSSNSSSIAYMFSNSGLTSFAVNNWNVSNAVSANQLFSNCTSLTSVNINNMNISNADDLSFMFRKCTSLISINMNGIDWSSCTNLAGLFEDCANLTTINNVGDWDLSNITYLNKVFEGCSSLENIDVSNWVFKNGTSMQNTFKDCSGLTSLDVGGWNFGNITSVLETFKGCVNLEELDVSNWDVSNCEAMYGTFYDCSNLTSLDVGGWDTSSVISFYNCFYNCSLLKNSFANFDISSVEAGGMNNMFRNCDINEEGTTANYDATLISWAAQAVNPNLVFNAGNSKYSAGGGGTAARAVLTGAPNNWTIYDGGEA